eukprot:TRINITY_DN20093_c0_g3_i3.p1 TRINITY_DN20093_c0_g3~~TRINITY_DN20093_c0_g3_i3.p1  ORF type:complete len:386 (-),score=34.05 TRINITY_DN20093_c0_g3_i3:154-1311(-)
MVLLTSCITRTAARASASSTNKASHCAAALILRRSFFAGYESDKWNKRFGGASNRQLPDFVEKWGKGPFYKLGFALSGGSLGVYSPAYRQAHVLTFLHLPAVTRLNSGQSVGILLRPVEAEQALNLAYQDVRRAFVSFVDDPKNAGRPFVLVGHSQGTVHLVRLLQEEVENHPARVQRFVHAYLTGSAVPLDMFSRTLRVIRPSGSASDIRSVSSWRTAAVTHPDLQLLRGFAFLADSGWTSLDGNPVLCNNPITWSSEYAGPPSDAGEHKGALWPLPVNMDPREFEQGIFASGVALRFGHVSKTKQDVLGVRICSLTEVDCGKITARVGKQGVLRVTPFKNDCLFNLTDRDWLLYHDLDFALFHNNLQENVANRVRAWAPLSRL